MVVVGSEVTGLAGEWEHDPVTGEEVLVTPGAAQYIDQGISGAVKAVTGIDVDISLISKPVLLVEHDALGLGDWMLQKVEGVMPMSVFNFPTQLLNLEVLFKQVRINLLR